jgi:hypothetical protein
MNRKIVSFRATTNMACSGTSFYNVCVLAKTSKGKSPRWWLFLQSTNRALVTIVEYPALFVLIEVIDDIWSGRLVSYMRGISVAAHVPREHFGFFFC